MSSKKGTQSGLDQKHVKTPKQLQKPRIANTFGIEFTISIG